MKALGGTHPHGSEPPALEMGQPQGTPSVPGHIPGAMAAGGSLVARGGVCTA